MKYCIDPKSKGIILIGYLIRIKILNMFITIHVDHLLIQLCKDSMGVCLHMVQLAVVKLIQCLVHLRHLESIST